MKTIIFVGCYFAMAMLATAYEPILLVDSENSEKKIEYPISAPDLADGIKLELEEKIPTLEIEEKIPTLEIEEQISTLTPQNDTDCGCDGSDEDDDTIYSAIQENETVRASANPGLKMDTNTDGSKVQGDTETKKSKEAIVEGQAFGSSVNPKSDANRDLYSKDGNLRSPPSNIEVPNHTSPQDAKPINSGDYFGSSVREADVNKNYVDKGRLVISGSYKYIFEENGDEVEYHYLRKYDKRPTLTGLVEKAEE